ncbi:MAG TPA: fused MFS/spermidine synthase, partial [Candidatus Dormibacteraeota bacterium]|nr:fused MFS/spermidine synthase [Candidatus Dormibacteraeota bacterium]
TYYEIDPTVVDVARDPSMFTFLRDCTPRATVTLGDGRLTLAKVPDHTYDLIVVDAFGGDAIPVHLLTREAIELYLAKLKPDGALLFNISNKYVDIGSVLAGEAGALGLASYVRADFDVTPEEAALGKVQSAWLVMSRNDANLSGLPNMPGWQSQTSSDQSPVWTDDFSDLLAVMRLG